MHACKQTAPVWYLSLLVLWVTGSLETTLKERHSLGSNALPDEVGAASFMCAVCAAACSKPVSVM